ncbi:MAG: MFS transporter [Acidobacteria bacterium]|nr:MFS transporter [Acidobacteriota bacterium]
MPDRLTLTITKRIAVLLAAFLGLLFDGVELGLMPIASLSVSKSLLGDAFTATSGGDWFARFTASLMLGAAVGGIALGNVGDRIGRTRAMGISILFYSVFAALGAFVETQEQMLYLRFMVGLGVGGMWPNGIALVSECWSSASKPLVSGVMMAGLNAGILLLSQLARIWPITPDSWRWIFQLSGVPAVLGILILVALPESPEWLASRGRTRKANAPLAALFKPDLLRTTLSAIVVSVIPLMGAWAASKWMIPWADKVAGAGNAQYKAATQGWWALGAILGAVAGAELASRLGRRRSYLWISIGATVLTVSMFTLTAPLEPAFHYVVFAQGTVATLFFGWLALYLPEIFPVQVRATGSGLAYNFGRFGTAIGVLAAGFLFSALGGDYPRVGAICALTYGLGIFAILLVRNAEK